MRELVLFAGAGGGVYGSLLLGHEVIGYVEYDDYCQRVIRQRQEDGIFPKAPIYGDIRAFNLEYAAKYRGVCDLVSGGFPCQPFSVAGKQLGADDPRNMWPATIECIRLVRPEWVFLENVPGLLGFGYFGTIVGDLAESGFDIAYCCLSASSVGAPHRRLRLWIMAHADTTGRREQGGGESIYEEQSAAECHCHDRPWACFGACEDERLAGCGIRRVSHGLAHRVQRLKALGNGQVPLCAATAFWLLLRELDGNE